MKQSSQLREVLAQDIEDLLKGNPHVTFCTRVLHETIFDSRIWIKVEQLSPEPTVRSVLMTITSTVPEEESVNHARWRFLSQYIENWMYIHASRAAGMAS